MSGTIRLQPRLQLLAHGAQPLDDADGSRLDGDNRLGEKRDRDDRQQDPNGQAFFPPQPGVEVAAAHLPALRGQEDHQDDAEDKSDKIIRTC